VGRPVEENPMRLDLEERPLWSRVACSWSTPCSTPRNGGTNGSGDPVVAHRSGLETSARMSGMPVPEPADVVIASSHPWTRTCARASRRSRTRSGGSSGGVHLTVVRPPRVWASWGCTAPAAIGRGLLRALAAGAAPSGARLPLKGMGEEERFFLYFALQAMRRATLLLYAPAVPAEARVDCRSSGSWSRRRRDRLARQHFPGRARVLVFPARGTTYVS